MSYFFTADSHYFHTKIIEYADRPFACVAQMNEKLIANWNSVVSKNDDVYHLGDFTLHDLDHFDQIIEQLNFRKLNIIKGGHDKRWLKNFINKRGRSHAYLLKGGNRVKIVNIEDSLITVNIEKKILALCHYAMRVWDCSHYGSWHLYGHSHGHLEPFINSMDVGVDTNNYFPYSWDQIKERFEK